MKSEHAQLMNGISNPVNIEKPYQIAVELTGSCPLILHRWNSDSVDEKAKAKKGSKEKKSDDIESYVWRDEDGHICLPGEYLRMAMCYAAKFKQDPRSPRKSAFDLFKAGIAPLTDLAKINGGVSDWEYLDRRRVVIQRNAITRTRPCFLKGWKAQIDLQIIAPEYIDFQLFNEVLSMAGRLIGVGDFRPTFGRFDPTGVKIIDLM